MRARKVHLRNCLLGQTGKLQKKQSRWWSLALSVFVLAILGAGYYVHIRNSRWDDYLARLRSEPGVVLTGSEKGWNHYAVRGLRDPFAADPVKLADDFGIAREKLQVQFEPYESLDERFRLQREFDSARQQIEQQMILFPVNSSALMPDQAIRLDTIDQQLLKLEQVAAALGRTIHVNISGRADQTGAEVKNAALSKDRAERVFDALRERGFAPEMMTAAGLGNTEPIRHGSPAYQLEVNRSVTLKIEEHQGDRR